VQARGIRKTSDAANFVPNAIGWKPPLPNSVAIPAFEDGLLDKQDSSTDDQRSIELAMRRFVVGWHSPEALPLPCSCINGVAGFARIQPIAVFQSEYIIVAGFHKM